MEFERESLYRDVWAQPIATLAKRFGISDNGLRKVCIALAIPLPARGHWAKVAAGHLLPTPPLPPATGPTRFMSRLAAAKVASPARVDDWLLERLAFEARPENAIIVPTALVKPHPLVKATATAVRAEIALLQRARDQVPVVRKPGEPWVMPRRRDIAWLDYERRGVMELNESLIPMRVSIESAERALLIWDALLKACTARSMVIVAAPRQVKISDGQDDVGLRMSEKVDRITRPAPWGSGEETARRSATGTLRLFAIHLGEAKFQDTPERPLELQLNDVMVWVHRSIASQRAGRALAAERRMHEEAAAQVRERERTAAAEAARVREEEERRLKAEQNAIAERERVLVAEAGAWRDAMAIRAYAAHVETAAVSGAILTPVLRQWLAWADSVAAQLDPTKERLGMSAGERPPESGL
ncbi:hypothetical protein E7V67_006290 [[Empedobacter] haloabium]|uniref:Uncharacterized protein n=1 Tax=[Empedobacter] haloabium TaxID=592317 RepID=A0ABZ1UQY5_9BURK